MSLFDDIKELESEASDTLAGGKRNANSQRNGTQERDVEDETSDTDLELGDVDGAEDDAPQGEGETPSDDGAAPRRDSADPSRNGSKVRADGKSGTDTDEGVDPPEETEDDRRAGWKTRQELREAKAKLAKYERGEVAPPAAAAAPAAEGEKKPTAAEAAAADPEPDQKVDPLGWAHWKIRQQDAALGEVNEWRATEARQKEISTTIAGAIEDFTQIQEQYMRTNPDYQAAANFGRQKYRESLAILHPQWTNKQIEQAIDYEVLKIAGEAAKRGLNPAEEIYHFCVDRLGYKRAVAQNPNGNTPPRGMDNQNRQGPKMSVIKGNKNRSATPLAGNGQGGGTSMTQAAAADMTLGQFAALDEQTLEELEAMEA